MAGAAAAAMAAAGLAATAFYAPSSLADLTRQAWLDDRVLTGVSAATAVLALILAWRAARSTTSGVEPIAILARLFEGDDAPRLVTDEDGVILYRNPAARSWFADGSLIAALEVRAARDFDGLDGVARLRQALIAGAPVSTEIPVGEDGTDPEWIEISGTPLTGVAIGAARRPMVWRCEDVTARRTINDILALERQGLADFLYLLPAGLYSADIDGTFKFVNQRLAEWLGYEPEDLIGTKIDDVIDGTAKPQFDGEWHGEVPFRTRSGETFPALVLQGAFDDAGSTRTRTLVIRDGTRRDPAAASGRAGYERFRALFNAAPVAIAIVDPEGIVTDCNESFEKLAGQPRAAIIGAALADRLSLEDRASFAAELARVIDGRASGTHLDIRVAGSAPGQASVYLGPLSDIDPGADSEIAGAVAHFIDTTEQKNLEVQFAQAQKMQAMGQLAGGVAHDFNNLLTAMIGFCDLLLQRHAAGDPSFADIMQIKQNANRAANLVRQLLAFSRKQPLKPRNLDVTDALTELSHLLTRLIGEAVEFKLIHGRDIGLVRVDPGQFDQIIINLAVNARDAMQGGGRLTIATGVETFDTPTRAGAETLPPGRYVRISVADTGKGIPPENLARIFEPFFSTKKEVPGAGTGLGLSTVYGIVRQTGGFILVDSSPGKGATFAIYLPRATPDADEAEAARAASGASGAIDAAERVLDAAQPDDIPAVADRAAPANVLLVEDEDAVRVFAARALKNKGYRVFEARTGEQALDILNEHDDIELMITDMMMPGMDGGTLARLIRVERPGVKIVLISGYSEEIAKGDGATMADFDFLPKPFSLGQLTAKVRDVLERG